MFEVTGLDIANLSDGDLRTLVARLALAELRAQGCPLSSVTAGGNQDAADGGVDVRVECPRAFANPDFVPRTITGFQVKKPDMPPGEIRKEMRPKGRLRPVIAELAAACGAYVIVSAQGSVADERLADRRKAMRNELHDLPTARQLHTDFYDRDRLATWVNEYPGIAAWVRGRTGLALAGWGSIGDWTGTKVSETSIYLFNEEACLTDERSRDRQQLTIGDGLARLRGALRTPKQCIRLIGLSGLGKTRLVQALFESDVGDEPLDPSLAIYTDYSVETNPTARDMARQLVMRGQRAILVVDNCNPATHGELARICSEGTSNVSLLTVEYDVRDDEPERTEVFRLQSTSPELISQWLKQSYPNVSQVDRDTIADFSGGNFRVARALSETLGNGETLGKLKSRDLFQRIFQQRNEPDQSLLHAAEELSLLYSVDGDDLSVGGELEILSRIRGVGVATMFGTLAALRRRGIVQSRGRWRAVLPHAIANPLASYALERVPPTDFDRFSASLAPRALKSLSRRIGYLHDSREAQNVVARWLRADGPLGDLTSLGEDGLQIITNIAPVAPEAVLTKIETKFVDANSASIIACNAAITRRWRWIRLIKALSYEQHMFERAAVLLARFVAAEPMDLKSDSARGVFAELFQLYLSGTQATSEQRRAVIRRLAKGGDLKQRRCASDALGAMLRTHHFSSSSNFDFGARSRDWGWCPTFSRDVWNWYCAAVDLTVELSTVFDEARNILAGRVRDLWQISACHEALDRAAAAFVKVKPWIEGWIAFRATLRLDGETMPDDAKARLTAIIERLKPSDLIHQARAVLLNNRGNSGWDIADGEPDDGDVLRPWQNASQMAQNVGRALANESETRKTFLTELLSGPQAPRAFQCGCGLAEEAADLAAMWSELGALFASADPKLRNPTVIGGFIYQAHQRDAAFASQALDTVVGNPALLPSLPYLQARIGIDEAGIARLRQAIGRGIVKARNFRDIANNVICDSPPEALGALLLDIAALEEGVEIALEILHMYFFCHREIGRLQNQPLIEVGRNLLRRADFGKRGVLQDFGMQDVISICCSGSDGEAIARDVSVSIRAALESVRLFSHDLSYALKGLFEAQPFIALDVFLLPAPTPRSHRLFQVDYGFGSPVDEIDPLILRQWADGDAAIRYPVLSQTIAMFTSKLGDEHDDMAPLFLEMLEYAPDKRAFLGGFRTRLQPRSWRGSLADVLVQRKAQVLKLRENSNAEVRQWVDEILPEVDRWIEMERRSDREGEQTFE